MRSLGTSYRATAHVLRGALRMPWDVPCTPTTRRRANLLLNRWEAFRCSSTLRSRPWILGIEPSNACNLRCPFCFTGAGGLGRPRTTLSLDVVRDLLDRLGDALLMLKAYNWGEPLLCEHLEDMVALAAARGIYTVVNSHLSLRLSPERAERLVTSGLHELVVSIDGARQETYARYRVGGRLDAVLANVRLLAATRARLGLPHPRLVVEFHPFPWNAHEADAVRALAASLDLPLREFKGCVPGDDWDVAGTWRFCGDPSPTPCHVLWTTATISADGGVAPCNGTFYPADDMGRIDPAAPAESLLAIWNGARYRAARRFFRERTGTAAERAQVCFDCPNTRGWEDWQRHRAAGGSAASYRPAYSTNDVWNYFWRRSPGARRAHADVAATAPLRAI